MLRTARQLIETALALLSLVNSDPAAAGDRAVFARGSRVPRGSRRAVLAARHSTRRDRSARAIQDQKDREILLSIFPDTARDRVPRAAMADAARSSRSATSGDVAAMLATVDEVREAVRPLVEYCQRCAPPLPAHLDTAGIEVLRRIAPEQLRATAVRVKALAIAGVAHRPLGLLVAKARTDPQFFDHADTTPVPPPHSGPAVGIEAGSTDDEQPDTDPDVAVDPDLPLAADQAAAIEAELDRRYGPSPTASPARAGLRALFTARATARTSP